MKIAKEDYKHIASLAGMTVLVIGWFQLSMKGVEHDTNQYEAKTQRQADECLSGLSNVDFARRNCAEILAQKALESSLSR